MGRVLLIELNDLVQVLKYNQDLLSASYHNGDICKGLGMAVELAQGLPVVTRPTDVKKRQYKRPAGKVMYACTNCTEYCGKTDRFCKFCGAKFLPEEKKE